jgi:hypothetical protein
MPARPGICTLVRSYVNIVLFGAFAGPLAGDVFGRARF